MSKKTSINKQRGQRTGALSGVGKLPIEPLAVFDALLPVVEEKMATRQGPPVANAVAFGALDPKHLSVNTSVNTTQSVEVGPGGAPVADGLQFGAARTFADCTELIDSLRRWQVELHQIDLELAHRSEDLAARRRAFARELRTLRREARLCRTPEASAVGEVSASDLAEIKSLKSQVDSLVEQNSQLATELAHWAVQRTVDESSDATASMSWEERRELLYRQFESEDNGVPFDPTSLTSEQCSRLSHEMACMQQELRSRDQEIAELRALLEQRPIVQDNELAVGAAAVTRFFDDDELIQEERQRLKEIQAEWEAKFRDMEIAASLERASLARERRQLECKNAELEEQIAHMKQEMRQESIAGPAQTRRWFAKLGLGE